MPTMNGVEFLRKIKETNSSVKTLLITAFDLDDKLYKELRCVDKLLQKPIPITDLIKEVSEKSIGSTPN
jgi:response regulator RpfG family c-di-GMP phosphodiesterase